MRTEPFLSNVNLEYTLPNGNVVKFLNDGATYLGYQLECELWR